MRRSPAGFEVGLVLDVAIGFVVVNALTASYQGFAGDGELAFGPAVPVTIGLCIVAMLATSAGAVRAFSKRAYAVCWFLVGVALGAVAQSAPVR